MDLDGGRISLGSYSDKTKWLWILESPITALPSLILVSGDIPLLVSTGVPSKGFPHIHGFYSKKRWQL